MSKISIKNLWKSYGEHQVLKGLNLEIASGETVVVLGQSGAGKSVLLRHIMGIETPDQGSVEVEGQRISELPRNKRYQATRHMGMLFQGSALFDSMDVGENTAFYLRQHESLSEEEIQSRVAAALEEVGLAGTQRKMPSDLSGGMSKRAALARLIIYRPSVVLYDEPTTGLDPITAMQIVDLINKTRDELHATAIVVTHDVKAAMELGDRLAFHHEGQIVHIAPVHEFIKIHDPLIQKFIENANIAETERGIKDGKSN